MSAVDDAKKYLSLRPPMENKTIFAFLKPIAKTD